MAPYLTRSNPAEAHQSLLDNAPEWRGALSPEAYFRREAHLASQPLTQSGGLTGWILAASDSAPSSEGARPQLAACETLRKRALLCLAGDSAVEEVTCYGVASVFCPPRERGRGYASEMIRQLGKWVESDEAGAAFSVLYSDIGKDFYSRMGWRVMESGHLTLSPGRSWPDAVERVGRGELKKLCEKDEECVKGRLRALAARGKNAVAIVPDEKTVGWQIAREDFVAKELYGKTPDVHGARTLTESGTEVWCLWTRWWYNTDPTKAEGNTLHILRLAVEDEGYDDSAATPDGVEKAAGSQVVKAITKLLQAARVEAHDWTTEHVELWNPSSATLAAAQSLDPAAKVTHREKESIASLKWCDPKLAHIEDSLVWTCNEKFAWC